MAWPWRAPFMFPVPTNAGSLLRFVISGDANEQRNESRLKLMRIGMLAAHDAAPHSDRFTQEHHRHRTRVADRSVTEDPLSSTSFRPRPIRHRRRRLNQAFSSALPSLNFPRPALTDGTDSIRPATLAVSRRTRRWCCSNSKRRHASPRQRQRHDRPRLVGRRPQHDPDPAVGTDRGASRRRLGALRLGCDRRRHQRSPA